MSDDLLAEAQKPGGKHHGFYLQYRNASRFFIHRAIRSLNQRIRDHEEKIRYPERYIANFNELEPKRRAALVNQVWRNEIAKFQEQVTILEAILDLKKRLMNDLERQAAIDNFVSSAHAYCSIIERAPQVAPYQLAEQCAFALATLYSHTLRLPAVEPCDETHEAATVIISPTVQSALAGLGRLPHEDDDELVADALNNSLLADDLSDIYIELMRGLSIYNTGTRCAARDAIWEWKFSFEVHWREHLVHALYMLDHILREHVLPEEPGA